MFQRASGAIQLQLDREGVEDCSPRRPDGTRVLGGGPEELERGNVLWFSYRRGFPPITPQGLTTDSGWGCTLRTTQMLVAQALRRVMELQGSWPRQRLQLLSYFLDTPSAPLSVHRMAIIGAGMGRPVGSWHGPAFAAHVMGKLLAEQDLGCTMHIATDGFVDRQRLLEQCHRPVLLVVPLRLNLHRVDHVAGSLLRRYLLLPQAVGAVGGTPGHSLYFVGTHDDRLLFLDPHCTQPAVDSSAALKSQSALRTFIPPPLESVSTSTIDPSIAVGFFLANAGSLGDLEDRLETLHEETGMCPFTFVWPRDDGPLEGPSPTGSGSGSNVEAAHCAAGQASPAATASPTGAAPATTAANARSAAPSGDRRSRGVGWLRRRGSAMRRALRPARREEASGSGGSSGQGGADDDEFVLVDADEWGAGGSDS